MSVQKQDDTILHQAEVEQIAGTILVEGLQSIYGLNSPIDDVVPITGGQSPTEAEHNLVVSAVNEIISTLRASAIVPEE